LKLYLAGLYSSRFSKKGQLYSQLTPREKAARDDVRNVLESYHYIGTQRMVETLREDGVKVFLDSGAFSAFTKGVEVDLPGYCEYVRKNQDVVETDDGVLLASVLDGIGDPLKTWQNQDAMERLGVRPLPCFHYGEDERYLEWYISHYPYVTLGGMVPISTPQLILWLDRIWERYLVDGSGRPRLKIHGFGLTTIDLMRRYPWYSIDSSTWVQLAAFGGIIVPGFGEQLKLYISSTSPSRKKDNQHLDSIPSYQREQILKGLASLGFDIERLQTYYLARWAYNCWGFTELNNRLNRKDPVLSRVQEFLF
jgi:hypothetical protein